MITKLRRAMFEREMTSETLSKLSDVPSSSIRYFMLGRKPNKQVAKRIVKALKLTLEELF